MLNVLFWLAVLAGILIVPPIVKKKGIGIRVIGGIVGALAYAVIFAIASQ